ncbi:hypothetical protein ONZ51_g9093 [Trametes cubensis]|uniref:Uncharacterized protein n=1 Tax=Trametes cubensis TaxID=1111947 RepID=A0AAD7TMF8_9APHY|nr:hypothetical protein ONZ51_g9093 [Trametes cubensis]
MARRCVGKLRLATASNFAPARSFHLTASRYDSLAAPPPDGSPVASSSSTRTRASPIKALRDRREAELRSLLSLKCPSPHAVWAGYLELLQFYGASAVPREIHQGVLRKCSPSPAHLRMVAAKRRAEGGRFKDSHLYETRFREVIRNIRASGQTPSLEDYHCVLELFVAVGNHTSAMQVFGEITELGLARKSETYSLCLQALAHRLALPVWHLDRPILVDEISGHCKRILDDMSLSNVPYTARNVDLVFRILKETMSMEAFSHLLKHAYGIDLAYPDRSPLEFWDQKEGDSSAATLQDAATPALPTRLPFSLAAFNTALDYLGRAGNVSKMIQLFEVVTNPLPSSDQSYADEDDDDFGVADPQVAPYRPPHVQPNTTTFHTLLRSLHKADHLVLARHYLLLAFELERQASIRLRKLVKFTPPAEIPAPRLAITRSLILPVFSAANDNKNTELMRWALRKTLKAIKWKRYNLSYFEGVRSKWIEAGIYQPPTLTEAEMDEEPLPLGPASSRFSTFFNPSSSRVAEDGSASASTTSSASSQPFNIDLHINLLRRDLDALVELQSRIEDVLARTVQRIKERLGRRVWKNKNIFLRDAGDRVPVSKDFWREHVKYRPQSQAGAQSASSEQAPSETPPSHSQEGAPPHVPHTARDPQDMQAATSPSGSPAKSTSVS